MGIGPAVTAEWGEGRYASGTEHIPERIICGRHEPIVRDAVHNAVLKLSLSPGNWFVNRYFLEP